MTDRDHSFEFEVGIIVSLLTNESFRKYCLGRFTDGFIVDEDLYIIYSEILRMHLSGEHISWLSLDNALKKNTHISDEKCEVLLQYVERMASKTADECRSYFESVKKDVTQHVQKNMLKEYISNAAIALNQDKLVIAMQTLKDVDQKVSFSERKSSTFWGGVDQLDGPEKMWSPGIALGIYGVDTHTQNKRRFDDDMFFKGGKPGQLMLIQGSSNYGKTTLALNMATFHMLTGLRVAVFSLEMTDEYLNYRTYSSITGISNKDFRGIQRSEMRKRLIEIRDKYKNAKDIEWIEYFGNRFTPAQLDMELTLFENDGKRMDVCYVDYLEIMDSDRRYNAEHELVKGNAQDLIKVAKEHNVFIIVLSQSNKLALREGSSGYTAGLSYGKIQACDYNIALNRQEESGRHDYFLTWDKNRFGKAGGTIKLTDVDLNKAQFFDILKAVEGI